MKITGINVANYAATKQNVAHKGLWGKENSEQVEWSTYDGGMMCNMGTDRFVTTKYYYPFLNETKDEIEDVRVKNTHIPPKTNDFYNAIHETRVEIKQTIPVTEKKYNEYISRELLSKEEMEVEDKLKLAKLQIFLR